MNVVVGGVAGDHGRRTGHLNRSCEDCLSVIENAKVESRVYLA